ncbi:MULTISPECIES: hypothetical protein [unclassified Mesorhizobium]|uniref:hypothetical protein n=1 Tax=unclassified Mesorhizobium TaxID=325217 RepID=UPI00112D4899|nr:MULTISPECIES: hypothetical protein [unclassified Mesorhizobium]MBZ9974145.1 hypothetical protein [Mesorhizobium sp. BR-1-1-10]TPK10342.1 hypothetical protein FJ543_22810 [Mesorhizobium sp. B2-5-7]
MIKKPFALPQVITALSKLLNQIRNHQTNQARNCLRALTRNGPAAAKKGSKRCLSANPGRSLAVA